MYNDAIVVLIYNPLTMSDAKHLLISWLTKLTKSFLLLVTTKL